MPDFPDGKQPILYGPDGKPLAPIETSEEQTTQPALPERHIKFRRLRGLKPKQIGLRILRVLGQWVLAFATLIALWEFIVAEPEIRPIDFGAKGPYPARFSLHNPLFAQMYNTQAAVAIVGGMFSAGPNPPDLREPMMRFPGPSTCEILESYPDLKAAARMGGLVLDATEYPAIEPGQDVPFATGIAIRGMRLMLAVGVRYKMRILGVRLWSRFRCEMFQSIVDSEGRTHLVPYSQ